MEALLLRMAFPLMWIAEAVTPSPDATPVAIADPNNPISVAYSWAQLLALLTDRALWLFFLGIILGLAWYLDRRKEKQIAEKERQIKELQEWQQEQIHDLAVCMDRVKHMLERLDRKLP